MLRRMGVFAYSDPVESNTAITTSFQCEAKTDGGFAGGSFVSQPSTSEQDFEIVYKIVAGKAEIYTKCSSDVHYIITLSGKLNGKEVNEVFTDIDLYHQYLQFSLLIETGNHPNFVTAIRLLRKFGLIDNADNQDISVEQQVQIKRELLALPKACDELAFYSDIYHSGRAENVEVAISYKCEVLQILQQFIPALQDIKLTGSRTGFIPSASGAQ